MSRRDAVNVPIRVIPDEAHRAEDPGSRVKPRLASTWTPDLHGCAACQG